MPAFLATSINRRRAASRHVTRRRIGRAVVVVLAVLPAAGAVAAAPAAPAAPVPIPVVHATTATFDFKHHPRVLVKTLEVSGLTGQFRVTCDRCSRLNGPIRRVRPAPGTVRFSGVNWLLVPGHDISVRTYRPRAIGRYELLVAAGNGHGLVFKTSGCLRSLTRRMPCPAGVGSPIDGSAVSGPATGSSPGPATGAPATTILSGPSGTVSTLPVTFTYAAGGGSASFQCALDGGAWLACPSGGISYGAIVPGTHSFMVRADAGGAVDPSPPQRTWTQAAPPTSPPAGTPPHAATPAPAGTPPAPPPALLGSTVGGGTGFGAGQYLRSANAQYQLILQADGNLVLYTQGRALWSSGTAGHPGATAAFQADGNFVVYGPDGRALWNAGSQGHPGSTLALQDDGNLVVYAPGSTAVWTTGTYTDAMTPGARLDPGQYLQSASRRYQLIVQGDGNFVLYSGGRALWDSNTPGHPGAYATMQTDGNLVVYSPAGAALWNSRTDGHPGSTLTLQNDGNVVVYSPSHAALFATNT